MDLMSRVRSWFGRLRAGDAALDDRYFEKLEGRVSVAGVLVSAETALRISAVFRCVSLLSNAFASLPGGAYRKLDKGGRDAVDHPVARMLWRKPNPYQVPFALKRMMFGHLMLRSNCYARIVRGREGPELWPLHPDRVEGPELLPSGRLRYLYTRPDTHQKEPLIRNVDIFHVQGLSQDGLRGMAVTDLARDSVGLAMATEQHGARLFSQGTRLTGVLTMPAGAKALTPDAKKELREDMGGFRGLEGSHGIPLFENGLDFKAIGMTADDAQFLETRKFTITDIARWFGIPPHMIGDVERSTSWGTGIEHQSIQFVQYGLLPWLVLWEEELRECFISEPEVYCKFNVAGLLRADAKTRFDIYAIGIEKHIMTPNQCRELEEWNPYDGGDEFPDKAPEPFTPTTPAPPAPPPEEDDDSTDEKARDLATRAASLLLREEAAALSEIALKHPKSVAEFGRAVAGWYGQHAQKAQEALGLTREQTAAYCRRQRSVLAERGVAALETWETEHLASLVEMMLPEREAIHA